MAELRPDILNEEEIIGGFQPGEPDDDSFSIQDKHYPGNIFLFTNPLPEQHFNEYMADGISEIDSDDFSTNTDIKDDIITEEESTPEVEDDLFEYEKKKLQKNPEPIDELEDPDFQGYLKGVMAVAGRKKSSNTNKNNDIEDILEQLPFDPISSDNADTEVLISDYDLDKPSTSTFTEREISEEDKNIPQPDLNEILDKPQEQKRERRKIPAWILYTGVAALFLTLLGAGFILFFMDEIKEPLKDKYKKDTLVIKEENESKKVSDGLSNKEIKDSNVKLSDNESSKPEDTGSAKSVTANWDESKNIQESKTVVKPTHENNNILNKTVVRQESKIDKDIRTEVLKNRKVKSEKPSNTEKNTQQSHDDFAEIKTINELDIQEVRNRAVDETFIPKDEPGIYIIQIYSSPSKEDALQWLSKLKAKNISDAFISEQKVRDKIWYRVRFGKFTTREEAKNAALRYGFAQTWIDREK